MDFSVGGSVQRKASTETQDTTTQKHADTHPCPNVQAVVDSTCLRPLGYWDRR